MDTFANERKTNAILGAAVADAASLGFHWLYDQDRILSLEPETPEFRSHREADYENVPGFFAHARRRTGEFSQYGEQLLVMLQSLAQNSGRYNKSHYENCFNDAFGYGGSYVGYIDHPTRDTLNAISRAEDAAIVRAESLPFNADDTLKRKLITKVLAVTKQFTGDEQRTEIEKSVRSSDDDDYLVAHALRISDEVNAVNGYHGADDQQLPAISKLPPLVIAYSDSGDLHEVVDSAVRVTNNNDFAADAGIMVSDLLQAVLLSPDTNAPEAVLQAAMEKACTATTPKIAACFKAAADVKDKTTPAAMSGFGMACQLESGLPGILHNLNRSASYTESVRSNIYAGGDCCGRSIFIGAVSGALYGVGGSRGIPQQWIDKLIQKDRLYALLKHIV